mmetsp:Transcript_36229/g.43628  ORF Transcript_36229/g.43628 Transcript_36229/m.43628 type:complete len:149 (-) Transcript_36229:40-486(-)
MQTDSTPGVKPGQSFNPGTEMASAVDAEYAIFRQYQEEIQKLRESAKILIHQRTENEMVKQELDLLDGSANVFKQVGPVLMRNDLDDAKQTVEKRLEFITGELKKNEEKLSSIEKKSSESAEKVQKMQGAMQAAAAEMAKQVAREHGA